MKKVRRLNKDFGATVCSQVQIKLPPMPSPNDTCPIPHHTQYDSNRLLIFVRKEYGKIASSLGMQSWMTYHLVVVLYHFSSGMISLSTSENNLNQI